MDRPVGYRRFHRQAFFDYQLNRLHALGFGRREEIEEAGARIRTRADAARVFEALAAAAEAEGRSRAAASYLRTAEFFMEPGSPESAAAYRRYRILFDRAFADEPLIRHEVPYGDGHLPAIEVRPARSTPLGSILVFGGFDSLIEELFVVWRSFADRGYRVIAFEGPGQGGARILHGQAFDHDWEKPVGCMLSFFDLDRAALIGISMGGYWAIRAAALEPRITQVVSWSPVYDWLVQLPKPARSLVRWMVRFEGLMNATIRLRMRLFPVLDHAVRQAMALAGGRTPVDAVRWLLAMNAEHVRSDQVTQDVLLIGGARDAFQPPRLVEAQRAALTRARSVTVRIFTAEEHAAQHCQMGNLSLALGTIAEWLDEHRPDRVSPETSAR